MERYEDLALLNKPYVSELSRSFDDILQKGNFILGEEVDGFEKEFSNYTGASYCVSVANGTDALTIALKCFGFKPGASVIVPSNTYLATILAVINAGLRPVLVEPDIRTYNLDPAQVDAALTADVVAIIPVHLYGKCCPMDELKGLAGKHNLKIIEDCCQAHGARYKGQHVGTLGHFGAFSFYPTKNLGALGDAGCLITNDEDLFSRARSIRNYGFEKHGFAGVIGFNSRLDEVQAAFLKLKLKYLDDLNGKRNQLAAFYNAKLSNNIVKPWLNSYSVDAYYVYGVRHPKRDMIVALAGGEGIEIKIHYQIPPHRQPALRPYLSHLRYPISDEIHATIMSLPISPIHTFEYVTRVAETVNRLALG